MKKPDTKGWLSIIGAIVALILACIAVFKDGNFTDAEAQVLKDKTGEVIDAVQSATAETQTETPAPATVQAE